MDGQECPKLRIGCGQGDRGLCEQSGKHFAGHGELRLFAGNFGEIWGCRGDGRARGRMKELSDRELGSRCSEGLLVAVEVRLSRCQLGLKRLDLSFQRCHALVILGAGC
jgi:hypothetical protein